MKELEKQTPIEQHQEVQQEQKYRLLGDLDNPYKLILYEFDPKTRVLKRAEILPPPKTAEFPVEAPKEKPKLDKGQLWNPEYMIAQHRERNKRTVGNAIYKDGHDYFFALNDTSASKKLDKMIRRGLISPE